MIAEQPDKWACEKTIDILNIWLDRYWGCPLHEDPDSGEECTCAEETQVIIVRDYLKELSEESK
jgi:hypothetical protein